MEKATERQRILLQHLRPSLTNSSLEDVDSISVSFPSKLSTLFIDWTCIGYLINHILKIKFLGEIHTSNYICNAIL